jgi:hypothetical protein
MSVRFLQENPTEDTINKITRMYEMLDKMIRIGDSEGIKKCLDMLEETIDEYQ